jgi:hypothetical protein
MLLQQHALSAHLNVTNHWGGARLYTLNACAASCTQNVPLAWVAVLVCVVGLANLKSTSGMQHVASAVVFSIMGVVANYLHTGPRGLAALFPPRPTADAGAPPTA